MSLSHDRGPLLPIRATIRNQLTKPCYSQCRVTQQSNPPPQIHRSLASLVLVTTRDVYFVGAVRQIILEFTGPLMSSLFVLTFLTALVLLCLCSPAVRRAILAGDDTLDAHEAGIAVVALRMYQAISVVFIVLIVIQVTLSEKKAPPHVWRN